MQDLELDDFPLLHTMSNLQISYISYYTIYKHLCPLLKVSVWTKLAFAASSCDLKICHTETGRQNRIQKGSRNPSAKSPGACSFQRPIVLNRREKQVKHLISITCSLQGNLCREDQQRTDCLSLLC